MTRTARGYEILSHFIHGLRGAPTLKGPLIATAIALPFLATVAPTLAADRSDTCSNASLKGRYGVTTHGVNMGVYDKADPTPPAIHYYDTPTKIDMVSTETFDGRGNSTFSYLAFSNGFKSSTPRVPSEEFNQVGATGSYRVNKDCTGVVNVVFPSASNNTFAFQRAFVLSADGKIVHMLWTEVHFPQIATRLLPPGATCAQPDGCDLAVQIHSDGERY